MKPFAALSALGVTALLASSALAQSNNADPAVNVRESQSYNQMVDHNPGFRSERIKKECDPIESPDLRRQCIESFGTTANSPGTSDQTGKAMRGSSSKANRS